MNNQMIDKKPLVSIVIPSYNHAKYIENSVLSIINQTYKNIELIVIDDASSDNSVEILKHLQKKYKFNLIIREKNSGLLKNLNYTLDIVQGEYLCMLGSDDMFYKDKIEKQVKCFLNNNNIAICYGNVTYIDTNGKIIKNGKTKHFRKGYVFNKIIFKNFIPLPTIMFKTQIIKEFNGFDERYFLEDYPLLLKITKKYPIDFIKDPVTYYRLHSENVSSNMLKMIKEVEKILSEYQNEPIYSKAISEWYLRWFYDLAKTENFTETKNYMHKAFKFNWYKPRYIKSYIRFLKKRKNQ